MSERAGLSKSNVSEDRSAFNQAQRELSLTGQNQRQDAREVDFDRQQSTRAQLVESLSRMDKTLQASRLLHLQQTHGNRFVQRIIAELRTQPSPGQRKSAESEAQAVSSVASTVRHIQPTGSESPPIARQPDDAPKPDNSHLFDDIQFEPPGEKEAKKFATVTLSVVKDPLLEALHRNDDVTFLNKLRELDIRDRYLLAEDQGFMDEIRHSMHGLARWDVQLILKFWDKRPDGIQELHDAVFDRDIPAIKKLLHLYPDLQDERITPGVREMLDYELRGLPEHLEVLKLYDEGKPDPSHLLEELEPEPPGEEEARKFATITLPVVKRS